MTHPETHSWLEELPEELRPEDWAYGTEEDITSFQYCPYCTGLFWNPTMHLTMSPSCMSELASANSEWLEKRGGK